MKTYHSEGMICLEGPCHLIYSICKIEYNLNEDETFQYIFTPNYSVMDLLTSEYFQGLPGLNLDLRKERYLRKNMKPVFITERVPSPNREDYAELMERVKMDFMDPIEYLIRSPERYSGDLLFVTPFRPKTTISFDEINGSKTNQAVMKDILDRICHGDNITINGQIIDDRNRKEFHNVLLALYQRSYQWQRKKQKEGILQAKKEKKYRGRKPILVDELAFRELLAQVKNKEKTPKEAAIKLGISIDKYYRFKKKLQNK